MSAPNMSGVARLKTLIRAQERRQGFRLLAASVCAALVSAAAVLLLGVSGWFITASALAGLAGPLVAHSFNFMVPSALIRFLAIVRTGSRYGERVTGHDAALKALAALRPQLFESVARGPASRALTLAGGDASSRMVQDVDAVQNRFVRLSAPWGAAAGLVAGIGLALLTGWMTALTIAAASAFSVLAAALVGRGMAEPAGRAVQAASGDLKTEFAALAAAAPELQAYGVKPWAVERLAERGATLERATQRLAVAGGGILLPQSAAMALAVLGVMATAGAASPPLIALAILAAVTTVESAGALLTAFRHNGAVEAAVERLGDLLEAPASAPAQPAAPIIGLSADLLLAPPRRLAVTGPSGAGKTTLIERLMHLRTPLSGEATLGGVDAADTAPDAARALFAYAPQQAVLLAGTVRENLKLALPGADDDALWAALEDADLAARIRAAPAGLNAPLGENGARLSGGERRRLGLARAYLRPAPWLVLDEPTEGLDAATETRVLERLTERLARTGQGLILVSHRPAPLALCDERLAVTGLSPSGAVQMALRKAQAAA
ncbi:amino acid ABC transporter ATP-binding/permease protein [Brevundimonas sp. NPDC003935]|uniref:amino acid ABC transporter ATP-binding/permease protein n=1 Tax=unclassified Brevundimonas TaxID=2622653 RepID=UPI0028AB4A5B|nr:ATP-binding cassette domain-containing protein [Brevundimonas sp.]